MGKKLESMINDLAGQLLMLEAKGDDASAKNLIKKYRVITPLIESIIDKLSHLPVDIRQIYPEI